MSDYLTPEEARRWTGLSDTADQTGDLEETITAVSAMIDAYCQRNFGQSESGARQFAASNTTLLRLGPFNDLVSVSAVKTDTTGDGSFDTTITDYVLEPHNTAGPETRPYTALRRVDGSWPVATVANARQALIEVTGVWGWPSVPAAVKGACRIQVARVFKRTDSPLGVAGFGEFGAIRISSRLDPDVQQMLDPYRILTGIA